MVINAGSLCSVIGEIVPARSTAKFCDICKKKLSGYNHGKYCFAHAQQGMDKDMDEKEKRVEANRKKSVKAGNKRYYDKVRKFK